MIRLADLRYCECGADQIAAVAPGTEPEGVAPDLLAPLAANASLGAPVRAWCASCWSARYVGAREAR